MLALCEAMAKKGRCSNSGNGPLMFSRLLDVVADAANVARTRFVGPRIPEVRGKIGNLRAQSDLYQQNGRSRKGETGT